MTIARQPDAEAAPSDQSLHALDAVNFFVGGALAGFGPFVAVFLGGQGWPPENIGFVLTLMYGPAVRCKRTSSSGR
jgi:hypothetical protein